MNVNSLSHIETLGDNPLETGIRPLDEVAQSRFAVRGTVTPAAESRVITGMGTFASPADVEGFAEAHGETVQSLQTIGTRLQHAMESDHEVKALMDELCGGSVEAYAQQLAGGFLQSGHGEKQAAVGTQFDSGSNVQTVNMFGLGPTELVIIGIIAVLLFGKRLPDVLRGLGKGIRGFKEEVQGVKNSIDQAGTGHGDGDEGEPKDEDGTEEEEDDGAQGGKKK